MDEVLREACEQYDMELTLLQKAEGGFLSDNYVLSNGTERFFLKQYGISDLQRLDEVCSAGRYFAVHDIPVIMPIKTKKGQDYFLVRNAYYTLFPFVEGQHCDHGNCADEAVVSFGIMLAKLHRAGAQAKISFRPQFQPWDKEKSLSTIKSLLSVVNAVQHSTDFDKLAYETLILKRELVQHNTIVYENLSFLEDHMIHGDYLLPNVFFDEHNSVSHVFDFEKTGYCARSFELFRSMTYSFWDENIGELDCDKAKIYFNAYTSVYPMNVSEVRRGLELFYLKSIHGFWVENEHYLRGNNSVDHFLLSGYQRTLYLSKYRSNIADFLIHE